MSSLYDQWGGGSSSGSAQSNGITTSKPQGMMQQNGPHTSSGGPAGTTQQWAIGWGCYPPAPSSNAAGMPPHVGCLLNFMARVEKKFFSCA